MPTVEEKEFYENYDTEKNERNLTKAELFLVEVLTIRNTVTDSISVIFVQSFDLYMEAL